MQHNPLPRLAWFAPLPPIRSGVAQYNIELLPGLASSYAIDLFVDGSPDSFVPPDVRSSLYNAHDFVWKHFRQPYDLIVYQLGNAPCHDYMWAYLVRHPGLVVLHDGQLHHARGLSLLRQRRYEDYRSEFQFNHPEIDSTLAELGVAGLLGALTYMWPLRRLVVETARLVIVHNRWLAAQIHQEQPTANIEVVDMGVPALPARADAAARIRLRHGIPADAVVFLALGTVTPEKRIGPAIKALAAIATTAPNACLLLAGDTVGYYDPIRHARTLGVADRVITTGFVPDEDVADYLAAADVCLNMRWPSSRETSAAWLRSLAAGRPTVITDLAHTADTPALDPRTWALLQPPLPSSDASATSLAEPAAVSIEILDEDHSLSLAMRRLAADKVLRANLGQGARRLWTERFGLPRMVSGYKAAIERARATPPGHAVPVPAHFVTTGTEQASRLLRQVGLPEPRITGIWDTRS
jgi:glycosyltransferase involved in cell wall biosynthesis